MMDKTVIFDFDGTLADSLAVLIKITNHLALEFGYTQIDDAQVEILKRLSPREIIKTSGIALWRIPLLMRRFQGEFQSCAGEVELFPEIAPLLRELKTSGYKLGIVSSNSVANIEAVLRHHQVLSLFSFVRSCSLFGKGRAIRSAMRANYVDPQRAVYVGDELRDVAAARRAGVRAIAVTWGFNATELLTQQQPDYVVRSPQEMRQVLGLPRQG
jgi:phosphoglycolate phosphatase